MFAVRGGGHMPLIGSNSIDAPGILLSMTKLKTIVLSEDKTVASIGPGNRWLNVYEYLEPHGLVVVGGRVGQVGVSGLLLGGGISFYSNQYGFASDNVVKYEVRAPLGHYVSATDETVYFGRWKDRRSYGF
jgi:FAD/FMN-containing dehydrogenase